MSQARRTRDFARSVGRGHEKNKAFLLPWSRSSRKMLRSPRLAHKASVMQATYLMNLAYESANFFYPLSSVKVFEQALNPELCGR